MKAFPIPVVTVGPGSQPAEDEAFEFIRMPATMSAFRMPSHPVAADPAALGEARSFLHEVLRAARAHDFHGANAFVRDLGALAPAARRLVDEALGEGEVSALIDEPVVRLQETGFPGFWRVRTFDDEGRMQADTLEVGPVPAIVAESALLGSRCRMPKRALVDGVVNAPSILTELATHSAHTPNGGAHVVNLTLLPVSPADVEWLVAALEIGPVTLLSRGYGNCRITSTRLRHTWWVQYFNSMDQLILNTIEVTPVPDVALAAGEDFADSIDRLVEWLATLE